MDATAQRARDREAFREFLEKHHYAPQGRFARVRTLEDKDLDALCRGTLGPVWAWTWRNVKNAEDMEIVKRNVNVARYSIDSCKQEREQAKAKRETLLSRKKQLEDALRQAREREQALLASVRGVEHEREALVQSASEKRQRELLRKAFNAKNDEALTASNNLLEEAQWLATAADTDPPSENQVDILLAEFKRMLKTSQTAENIDFGDSDIQHLRGCSGEDLMEWLMEAASRPYDDVPENEEDAKYAAHVEKHSSSSHDALVQIQDLLRQSQAEHIASFVNTQKVYAKVHELKQRVDEAMAPEDAQYGLWGSHRNGEPNVNGEQALAAETVELQMQSQASAAALHVANRALDDVIKQVETHRQQKHELEDKVALMNQFDERQQEIVAQIRTKYRHNQELLESLTRKQTRLRRVVADEIRPRVAQDSDQQLSTWSRLVMDELRAFSSMGLGRLDTAHVQLPVAPDSITEYARQAETTVPFEEFYINQVQDRLGSNGSVQQQQQRNGYHRLAEALKLPAYASWASILASLKESESQTTAEISEVIQQLERDIAEDRTHSIPEAQVLLRAIQQSAGTLVSDMLPRLEHVVHVNDEIMQRSIPELDQAIDNWYNQPAWAARVEQQPNCSQSLAQ